MADPTDPSPLKSTLPILTLPEGGFKSNLPDFLLPTDPNMKWLMEQVSVTTQAANFACQAAVTHNEHLRILNGRTLKNEKAAEDIKADVAALKDQSGVLSPVSKALASFTFLWESKPFKVIFILGLFVVAGVLYPWYVQSPGKAVLLAIQHWLES